MGGMDKADMHFALYRTKMRTTKWYHRITFHLFSLAAVNSFVIYRQLEGTGSLLDFLTDICRSLLLGENNDSENGNIIPTKKVRSLKASEVPVSVCFYNIGHWPVKSTINRCKMDGCSSRTKFICAKCQVYLFRRRWQNMFSGLSLNWLMITYRILVNMKHYICDLKKCFFSFFVSFISHVHLRVQKS